MVTAGPAQQEEAGDGLLPAADLFAGVVGQPAAVTALRTAARQPVHAYLFRGPAGSGSRPAALAFAAALLCPAGGCGRCPACRQALAGTHPDVVLVERTGASIGVDDARRLVGLAQRRPLVARRQVVVVTDVHLAVRSAPALLKTVEEPPPSTVFVLLAEDVPPELVTVASRCVEVGFPPVPDRVVAEHLVGLGMFPEEAALVAEGAAGDLDRARLLAEDDGYAGRLELWRSLPARLDGHGATAGALARQLVAEAEEALGPLRSEHAEELRRLGEQAEAAGERAIPGRREVLDRQHRQERRWRTDELRIGLGVLARAYRQRMVEALAAGGTGARPLGAGVAERIRGDEAAVDLITEAAAALKRNPNETLLLEALLVRLEQATG